MYFASNQLPNQNRSKTQIAISDSLIFKTATKIKTRPTQKSSSANHKIQRHVAPLKRWANQIHSGVKSIKCRGNRSRERWVLNELMKKTRKLQRKMAHSQVFFCSGGETKKKTKPNAISLFISFSIFALSFYSNYGWDEIWLVNEWGTDRRRIYFLKITRKSSSQSRNLFLFRLLVYCFYEQYLCKRLE